MMDYHLPNLGKIAAITDKETRFYALIGAVVSLGAVLELAYFDIFCVGIGIRKEAAAEIFYKVDSWGARRGMADAAMRHLLADKEPEMRQWAGIMERIVSLTGKGADRHLVSHNVVRSTYGGLAIPPMPEGYFGSLFHSLMTDGRDFHIVQDQTQVMAGKRSPKRADFDGLLGTAIQAEHLVIDLEIFLQRARQKDESSSPASPAP